jgi:hypothetical protein
MRVEEGFRLGCEEEAMVVVRKIAATRRASSRFQLGVDEGMESRVPVR